MSRPFRLVDVFGAVDFAGNPLAVVADAEGLDAEEMQRIARWLNLSETTFLLAPTDPKADYRVRIFTVGRELAFAGHPTLGSCHAWLEAGGRPKGAHAIVQECGAGLIPIRRDAGRLAFAAPPTIRSGPVAESDLAEISAVLRIERSAIVDAQWCDNGPGWVAVMLDSAAAVLALEPETNPGRACDIGVVGPHLAGAETAFEIRALFSDGRGGLIEDPATGSLNASVAQWLFASGRATGDYVASQGGPIGRDARIHVSRDAQGDVWIGGRTVTLACGLQGAAGADAREASAS